MPPPPLIDIRTIDCSTILADQEAIRRVNPQRHEMEQLTAIVYVDHEEKLVIGYKDVVANEFWSRGHMPDFPLLPGVLMCESAAQLASYYCQIIDLMEGDGFIGFGGMEDVRFRGIVRPGDRLVIACKATRLNRRQSIFETQGFVDAQLVFQARIIGVPITLPETFTPAQRPAESKPTD